MVRLYTRGSSIENPSKTFVLDTSFEQKIQTGLDQVTIEITTDGSNIANIEYLFIFPEPADDFKNVVDTINFCGEYKLPTSALPIPEGVLISDSADFVTDVEAFNDFERQLRKDFSLELKLK